MAKQNHILVLEHDNNFRSGLIRLRMRHGSAGYGIYHLLLEYLLTEPEHTAETDYDVLGFVFREDAALVKSVVEDFGLFSLSADGSRFSHEWLTEKEKAKKEVSASRRKAAMRRWGEQTEGKTIDNDASENNRSCMNDATVAVKKENQKKQEKTEKNQKEEKKENKQKKEVDDDVDSARARAKDSIPASSRPTSTTIAAAAPSATADNYTYLRQFFGNAGTNGANIQALLMTLGMRADEFPKLRQMAEVVLAEWRMAEKRHTDYSDFSRHLISTLRIRLARMKQTAATMPVSQETADDRERQCEERRREWAERERKAVTYEEYQRMKREGLIHVA